MGLVPFADNCPSDLKIIRQKFVKFSKREREHDFSVSSDRSTFLTVSERFMTISEPLKITVVIFWGS